MKDETKIWLNYSNDNLDAAKILLKKKLYNPCLQNLQQSVEKGLKALLIEKELKFKKTHNITELRNDLLKNGNTIDLSEEDCEFLDSIYIPSKYPIVSALPFYEPDKESCKKGIAIAEKLSNYINELKL